MQASHSSSNHILGEPEFDDCEQNNQLQLRVAAEGHN